MPPTEHTPRESCHTICIKDFPIDYVSDTYISAEILHRLEKNNAKPDEFAAHLKKG